MVFIRSRNKKNKRIVKEVFKLIAAARRPLLLDELQEALSITVGESYSTPGRYPPDIEKDSAWCANLVEIDGNSNTV